MIGLPPSELGALQVTVALAFPAMLCTLVGASGRVFGVIGAAGAEATEVPATFVAVTVKVYAVPLSKPDTVALVPVLVLVTVAPPGIAVTL